MSCFEMLGCSKKPKAVAERSVNTVFPSGVTPPFQKSILNKVSKPQISTLCCKQQRFQQLANQRFLGPHKDLFAKFLSLYIELQNL